YKGQLELQQFPLGIAGILLGYGKENALLFHCRRELEKSIKAVKNSIKNTIPPRTSLDFRHF
ncbi:MAG: hypothetical protein ACHQUC_09410, partial [Chlamydiales bacterium]